MSSLELDVKPLDIESTYGVKAYKALKKAITEMDIYDHPGEVRLDERNLSEMLGVSQAIFANLMGVSGIQARSWESGARIPSGLARRLLDEINSNPARWRSKLKPKSSAATV